MAKFEVVGDIERNGKTFTVLKGIRGTVFSDRNAETKFTDLDGEFFHEKTWFGDDYGITRKFLMYDHGQNDLSNEFAIPNPVIGVAELKSVDASARWFEVELDKANEMYPAIMELNNLGLLGVSSRTLPGKGICIKSADGAIDNWPEVELSFTTTPADPRTRFSDEEIVTLKSIMTKYLPRIEKATPQEPVAVEEEQKDASLYLSINADLDNASAMDVVEAAIDAAADAGTSPAASIDEAAIISMLAGLVETALNPWKAKLEETEKKTAALEARNEELEKAIVTVKDHVVALKKDIGKSTADYLRGLSGGAKNVAIDILTNGKPVPTKEEKTSTTPPPAQPTGVRTAFANGYAPGSR